MCRVKTGESRIFGEGNEVNLLALDCGIKYSISGGATRMNSSVRTLERLIGAYAELGGSTYDALLGRLKAKLGV